MDRTTAPGSIAGQYIDDDPPNEIQGTLLVAKDRNAIQEEIISVIEAAGLTPSADTLTQLRDAVRNASNLSAGTLPDARLSTLFTRSLGNSVNQAGWFNIVKMEPYSSAIISVKTTGGSGESSLLLSVSTSAQDPGFAPTITVLASGGRNNAANRISHVGSRATSNILYWVYIYFAGATTRVVDVEIIQSTRFRPIIQTISTPEFPNLTDISNRTEVRYNEGIDATRIGGQLASNIPKLDQANVFAPGVVQTTGQQTIDIGNNFSAGTKGVKVRGRIVGYKPSANPAVLLLCQKYAATALTKTGFIGEVIESTGSQFLTNLSNRALVQITQSFVFGPALHIHGNATSIEVVEVLHTDGLSYFGLRFSSSLESTITIDGLLFEKTTATVLPTFINSTLGYTGTITPVPTASLQALRGKFNASDLADGTLPDGRFPATLPALSGANLTSLNASNVSTGTLADARFSSNVPLKNASNTFTSQQLISMLNALSSIEGTNGTAVLGLDSYKNDRDHTLIATRAARGTKASPLPINDFDRLFNLSGTSRVSAESWGTTSWDFEIQAQGNQSTGNQGTRALLWLTKRNQTTPYQALTVDDDGVMYNLQYLASEGFVKSYATEAKYLSVTSSADVSGNLSTDFTGVLTTTIFRLKSTNGGIARLYLPAGSTYDYTIVYAVMGENQTRDKDAPSYMHRIGASNPGGAQIAIDTLSAGSMLTGVVHVRLI